MKTMTVEMPVVQVCAVQECAYNAEQKCHAKAITIGDGVGPACDTAFLRARARANDHQRVAGIGACKATGCVHNSDLECTADAIRVGMQNESVACLTFSQL